MKNVKLIFACFAVISCLGNVALAQEFYAANRSVSNDRTSNKGITAAYPAIRGAGVITGAATVCAGATTNLTDVVTGGVWSSSNVAVATVNASGVVTGLVAGSATISYTLTDGDVTSGATAVVTVNPLPNAGAVRGITTICHHSISILTDTADDGIWSSGDNTVAAVNSAGVVTGVAPGSVNISYSVANACGADDAIAAVLVVALPEAGAITGTTTLCAGGATSLENAFAGGVWSSSNTHVATVDASGVVKGLARGTAVISYTVSNSCGIVATAVKATVRPQPNAGIVSGSASIYPGATTALHDGVRGGRWSSSDNTIATVDASGIITGIAPGTVEITYNVFNSCGADDAATTITVKPLPSAGSITSTLH
jgi:trimeric autotransporter adhesin